MAFIELGTSNPWYDIHGHGPRGVDPGHGEDCANH